MIFIDSPSKLRLGDLTSILIGWYACTAPCTSIRVRAGNTEFPCRLEERADVQQAYPHLFSRGFRCALDFLMPGATIPDSMLELDVLINSGVGEHVRIPTEPGWAEDIRALRASSPAHISPGEE